MAMGKGIGGMAGGKTTGKMRTIADFRAKSKAIREGFRPGGNIDMAVKASRAAKTAAPAAGLGVLSNGPAAKAAGSGMMGNRSVAGRTVGDALTSATGKSSKMGKRPASKKPFGTL